MKKYPVLALLTSATLAVSSFAAEIPNGLSWLPSDPLDITLDGNQTYDLWLNLAGSANSSRTYTNPLFPTFPFPYTIPGNTGYGLFPGSGAWPAPIKSQLWTDGHQQGELEKISNGTGGGPFPSGSSIYYGGASPVPNTNGGTLGATAFAIDGLQTITFQLSLGEAYGYALYDVYNDGFDFATDGPKLELFDTQGNSMGFLAAKYSDIIKKAYNGSLDMPPGSGVDEDIYINTFGLQWDLSDLGNAVGSFRIDWTGVQHAQLWSFRIDQTDEAYTDFVFDITSHWTGAGDGIWSSTENWQNDTVASQVGKAVFATGNGVELTTDTTVGQITIQSEQDFTIHSQNHSKLNIGLNIITEAQGESTHHTVSTDLTLPTTVTLDVGEDTTLTISGDMSGVGFYKRGKGELISSGENDFTGNLIFAEGTTIINGTNATSGGSLLDIKNARVILQGSDRFSDAFGAKLAGTSTLGQTAYLQLGDETTGAITQTLASLNAVKPQYVKDLNPTPQTEPPVYVVGGSSEISTLTVKGGLYSGYLGGEGMYEDNLSLIVDGNLTLQGTSTYVGDTIIRQNAILQINREIALSAHSNLVFDGGQLALGTFNYLTPGGTNDNGIVVTESVDTFTRTLGTGAGEVQFVGDGGFRAVGGNRTVNLGGDERQVIWGEGNFVGDGNIFILSSDNSSKITFANAIDLGNSPRTIQVDPNSTAELSGVLSGDGGGLVKTGSGFLFLSGLNTYTGATRIEGGQLRLSAIGNAGAPSILGNTTNAASHLVLAGGQLNYVGSVDSTTDRLFTLAAKSGSIANDGTGTLHFTNTGAIVYDYAGAVEFELRGTSNGANRFDALITDNGTYTVSLRKGGSSGVADSGGVWILGNGANSYTGSTFINSGILEVVKLANGGQVSSIGASAKDVGNLKFFRGGLRYIGEGDSTDRLFSISSYGTSYTGNRIDASGTGALKFTNTGAIGLTTSAGGNVGVIGNGGHLILGGTNTDDNTLAAQIGGSSTTASRLTKDGTGKWILSGVNSSYKGITEILGGTLGVHKLANGNANSSIGSSSNVATNLVLNGGTLQYLGAGDSTDRRFTVGTNGGGLDASGTGVLTFTNTNAVTYATNNVARTLTLSGTNTGDNILAATIGNAGTGATSLVKNGTGKWVLTGNNTYTGGTQINEGILLTNHSSALGTGTVSISSVGTLLLGSNINIANNIEVSSGGQVQKTITTGSTYSLGSTGSVSSGDSTSAGILAGAADQETTVNYHFTSGMFAAENDNVRISDVFTLTGTGNDLFVLSLATPGISETSFLGWFDNEKWINAILGNTNNNASTTQMAFLGSFNQFQSIYGMNLSSYIGAYGVDATTQSVWAVLNHNSDFSVIPEPGTLLLIAFAGCLLLILRGRRNRAMDV